MEKVIVFCMTALACLVFVQPFANSGVPAQTPSAALENARALFASGQAMEGVLVLIEGAKAIPEDGAYAHDMLALGQTFKFAYDDLLTTLEQRQLLEERLRPGTTIIEKTLWLTCFPSFDSLGDKQQTAALTLYGEVLASDHVLAKIACLALAISVQQGWQADDAVVGLLNEISVLESGQVKQLTREILGSALSRLKNDPDRLAAFLDAPGWNAHLKATIAQSSFCKTLRQIRGAWGAANHAQALSKVCEAIGQEDDATERYYLIKLFDAEDRQRDDVRATLLALAREASGGPDVTHARILLLREAITPDALKEVSELATLLLQQQRFPVVSDLKLESEAVKTLARHAEVLVEQGRKDNALAVYEGLLERYPESRLAERINEKFIKHDIFHIVE
ncbi:MAG: hypothetical protein ACOYI9_12800 [Candidatus Hydrogenedentales bacterium]|jgi:tetratricopeptide (TPR) repeat protein